MREEKSISWNLVQSLPVAPKPLPIHFSYRPRIQDTAGEPTYNLGRRLLIQSRPVRWRKGGGVKGGRRQGAPPFASGTSTVRESLSGTRKLDGGGPRSRKEGEALFTLKSRDPSSSLVQLCAPRLRRGFALSEQSRAVSLSVGGKVVLGCLATPATTVVPFARAREMPAVRSHRRTRHVLVRGGRRVARAQHSRWAKRKHVRPGEEREKVSTGSPALSWETHEIHPWRFIRSRS